MACARQTLHLPRLRRKESCSEAPGRANATVRNPVKVIARSTLNVIIDSTVSDHLTERSGAGFGL